MLGGFVSPVRGTPTWLPALLHTKRLTCVFSDPRNRRYNRPHLEIVPTGSQSFLAI
jgi:hypothetical protein